MAKITDTPPTEIQTEIEELSLALDQVIPPKALDRNLLIATWNIRAFGDLTEKWTLDEGDSPKRNLHALRCIVDILERFDVIAIQEVRANLKALRHTLKVLGPNWGFLMSDVTRGKPGNSERMVFLYDRRKLQPSGLACELVVPEEQLDQVSPDALHKQFARTPYAVSFRSATKTFILVTLHVLYGKNAEERLPELKAIAEWMADWARDINAWDHNLIALGDFNIDHKGDLLYDAFTETGLFIPEDMHAIPRTIFSNPEKPKFYDQIAWFLGDDNTPALSLEYLRGGSFDFKNEVMKSLNLSNTQLSWRISDHYPLWAEFSERD